MTEESKIELRHLESVIVDTSKDNTGWCEHPIRRFCHTGETIQCSVPLQLEHSVAVSINGILSFRVVCSPDHIAELVLGRLFTEGIIAGLEDVDNLWVSEDAGVVYVRLKGVAEYRGCRSVEVVQTTGTGNKTYDNRFAGRVPKRLIEPIIWKPEWVFALARRFAEDSPMHKRTSGAHSCYLSDKDEVLIRREDIGRHNALDKVVGAALMSAIDLGKSIVFTSGRTPVDMVQKAIRSGIPVLVTKAVPTDITVKLACQHNLTLICQARPDCFGVYADPMDELWSEL